MAAKNSDDSVATFSPKRPRMDSDERRSPLGHLSSEHLKHSKCPEHLDSKPVAHCFNNINHNYNDDNENSNINNNNNNYNNNNNNNNNNNTTTTANTTNNITTTTATTTTNNNGVVCTEENLDHHHHDEDEQQQEEKREKIMVSREAEVGAENQLPQQQQQHEEKLEHHHHHHQQQPQQANEQCTGERSGGGDSFGNSGGGGDGDDGGGDGGGGCGGDISTRVCVKEKGEQQQQQHMEETMNEKVEMEDEAMEKLQKLEKEEEVEEEGKIVDKVGAAVESSSSSSSSPSSTSSSPSSSSTPTSSFFKKDENMLQITTAENEMDTSLSEDPLQNADFDNPNADNFDNVSEISDLSVLDEDAWRPVSGPLNWVQRQMSMGRDPRMLFKEITSQDTFIPPDLDEMTLWGLLVNFISEPPKRQKLNYVNTIDDVVHLLKTSQKIMVLTGAGVSVSCGIPDFRSRNGIYARLAVDFPDLPDPQAMFDIHYFRNDPRPFFKFAKEIYPGQFEPSKCHKFIKLIEDHNRLLHNYTQNIDTLEQQAGIKKVIQCHGSFATATCMNCSSKVSAASIREDIFNQVIPRCQVCRPECTSAIMKPDIVFFGENLPEHFHHQMAEDKEQCDLLIVIGSSMKVRPVALIPNYIPAHVPQILINREPLKHMTFDVELLGDGDIIVNDLCKRLGEGWKEAFCDSGPSFTQIRKDQLETPSLKPELKETGKGLQNSLFSSPLKPNDVHAPSSDITKDCLHDTHSIVPPENTNGQDSLSASNNTHLISHSLSPAKNSCEENNDEQSKNEENGENADIRSFFNKKPEKILKQSLGKQLKENQVLFLAPSQYVYPGAEIYSEDEEMIFESDSHQSVSSCSWDNFSDEDNGNDGGPMKNGFESSDASALNSVPSNVDMSTENHHPSEHIDSCALDADLNVPPHLENMEGVATTISSLSSFNKQLDVCQNKEHLENEQEDMKDVCKENFLRLSDSNKQNGYAVDGESIEDRLSAVPSYISRECTENTQHNEISLTDDKMHHIRMDTCSNSPIQTEPTAKSLLAEVESTTEDIDKT
ncbi:NAD-dependent protein deacetylase sir-2.1 [Octopus sinensis]|uniref:protein acetyllysine N-acetyltransferase n=1 Tax=Octopus sinensis TaxID=2607531 RepID=A0A6P7SA12_9MOLL|nr:NAD-dependent protein deacetylase sir-2.1 [Octopus sinensis]